MSQSNTPETWTKKLEASEKRHLTRVRGLRRDILADESLGDLDRAVLGMTGSQERLTEYQDLARKIGAQAGHPIIAIEAFDEGKVRKAKAGIIDGDLEVEINRYDDRYGEKLSMPEYSAELSVPVNPILSYAWYKPEHRESADNFFFDKQTTGQDVGGGDIVIARFSHHEYRNNTTNPDNDVRNNQANDVLLVGREDIYAHDWFSQGIGKILLALERYPVESKERTA